MKNHIQTNRLKAYWFRIIVLNLFLLMGGAAHQKCSAQAAAGQLDLKFGILGRASTAAPAVGWWGFTRSLLQPDGKIIIANAVIRTPAVPFFVIARYMPDGSLDNSWGQNGIALTEIPESRTLRVHDIKIQPDGKVLLAGFRDSLIAGFPTVCRYLMRYLPDGTIDSSFGNNGKITLGAENETSFVCRMLLLQNRIITFSHWAGSATVPDSLVLNVFRISNGTIDSNWGNGGRVSHRLDGSSIAIPVRDLLLTNDTNILVTYRDRIYRFLPDGQWDTTFGSGGYVQPIHVIGGQPNTTPDSLGNAAKLSMVLQPDGKILIAGISQRFSPYAGFGIVERYLPNGLMDSSFANNGVLAVDFRTGSLVENNINAIALLQDGSIIMAGNVKDSTNNRFLFTLAKYNTNGEIDTLFGYNGKNTTSFHTNSNDSLDYCYESIIQPDGKILLTGHSPLKSLAVNGLPLGSFSVARFHSVGLTAPTNVSENIKNVNDVHVFPNPLSSQTTIRSRNYNIQQVAIYNLLGQIQKEIPYTRHSKEIRIDLGNFSSGIYFLQLQLANGETCVKKIVKE